MDAAELISRFKALPQKQRVLAAIVVGALYPAYVWSEDLPPLEEQLESAQREESAARAKLEKLERDVKKLPDIEAEFQLTQDQLAKAKALLPEKIPMEEILAKTASIARETRITLKEFQPAAEKEIAGDYRYAEIPIGVSIQGQFGNVMSFYDRMAHLSGNFRLRGLKINPTASGSEAVGSKSRGGIDVQSTATLVFFRSTDTGGQIAATPAAKPAQTADKESGGSDD